MKNLLLLLIGSVIIVACNSVSGSGANSVEDSFEYYPPTPGKLEKQEFRRYFRELSSFFDSTLLRSNFNGGILVAKDGEVLYEKYIGRPDLRKKDTITEATSFHIASTGKTFTAMAILQLVQQQKISLTDTINKFFPGFPYKGITVEMLLNHRSGLPNYVYFIYNSGWDTDKMASNDDMLQILYKHKPPINYPPGKRFSYSNTNFALLATIVERVSGMRFPDYMKKHLFDPLQMKNTFVFTLKDTATAIPSFNHNGHFWDYDFLDATYGAKNIYSTPRDLLKWDQALYSGQLIRQSLLDSAFSPYSFEKPGIENYGYGWRLKLLPNNKKVIYHYGKWHGFNAAFARLTDEKVTIIILGNRFTKAIYRSANQCFDIFGTYLKQFDPNADENNAEPDEEGGK